MSVLTISAVDPVTNQLTVTAHGLNNGDGPVAVFTQSGAIPGGLAAATDFWAIVVDANTIKLATSSTNALAGTAIDITSAGSGTLLLLVGLPYRRARTYAPLSQLKSADLNSLQDDDLALWNLLTGQPQAIYDATNLTGTLKRGPRVRKLPIALGSADAGSSLVAGAWTPAAVSNNYAMPLELHDGERMLSVVAYVECGTTDQFVLQVYRWDAATKTATQLGTNQTSTGHAGAAEALTQSGLTEISSNHYNYYALIQCTARGAGTLSLMGVELTTDVP